MMRWLFAWRVAIWLTLEVGDLILCAIIGITVMWWIVTHPPNVCQIHAHDLSKNERATELCSGR